MLGGGNLSTAVLWEDKQVTFEVSAFCQCNVQFLSSLSRFFTDLFLQ